ncbi:MAG: hypothetical protein AB1705_08555 [Verrucomicrobiota bacterium]
MNKEVCVKRAALGLAAETAGESVMPEEGDVVQLQGKVTRIDGEKAYVAVDGAVGEDAPKPRTDDEEEADLQRMAAESNY